MKIASRLRDFEERANEKKSPHLEISLCKSFKFLLIFILTFRPLWTYTFSSSRTTLISQAFDLKSVKIPEST